MVDLTDLDPIRLDADRIYLAAQVLALTSAATTKCDSISEGHVENAYLVAEDARLLIEMADVKIHDLNTAFANLVKILMAHRATVSA